MNSRHQKTANQVWRRRHCTNPHCDATFTTNERADVRRSIMVLNAHGTPETYLLPELIFASIYEACKHREQAASDAAALSDTVLHALLAGGHEATTTKREIATAILKTLKNFDDAAAAVYRAYHKELLA